MMDVTHQLFKETAAAKTLRAQLADILEGDEELGACTVEGETNLYEAINAAVSRLLDDLTAIEGIEVYQANLARRRERLKQRVANMKTALAVALEQAGRKKYEHEAVTMSLRSVPPSVQVTDEAAIPSSYWKAAEPRLDKAAVLAALKAKQTVPGTVLSNGGTTIAFSWG
jgi:hypothetical protein